MLATEELREPIRGHGSVIPHTILYITNTKITKQMQVIKNFLNLIKSEF